MHCGNSRIAGSFAILTALCACGSGKNTSVPVELIGVWKTSAPTHADRYFQITKDSIVFGTGEGRFDSHPILSIEKLLEEGDLTYVISYSDGGQKSVFSFHYDPANNGVIRIKNQAQLLWTKERR